MRNLKHLTKEERELITVLHAKYYSIRQIAKEIGRSPATISRELNRKEAGYLAYGIPPALSLGFISPKCMDKMVKLNNKLTADEVKVLHSAGDKILEQSGLTAKGVIKQLGMTDADEKPIFASITKILDKLNVPEEARKQIFQKIPFRQQLDDGVNAFLMVN